MATFWQKYMLINAIFLLSGRFSIVYRRIALLKNLTVAKCISLDIYCRIENVLFIAVLGFSITKRKTTRGI